MSEDICLLITLVQRGTHLIRCALKVKKSELPYNNYYLEQENKDAIRKFLPSHVGGRIVEVQEIFEVVSVEEKQ